MKKTFVMFLMATIIFSCKVRPKIDENYVITKFQENADKINLLEYRMQRIDTFAQGGTVWNHTGVALIEKDKNDKVFGFSFYGKRDDIPKEYIYDAGKGFEISKTDKTYKIEPGNFGFIGSPGGQMVHQNIFKLNTNYKKVSLSETENSYLLAFEFENDTVYNFTDQMLVYELNKTDFFPIQIKQTSKQLGNKSVSIAILSDVKTNKNVTHSIQDFKQDIQNYTIIEPEKREPNKLLSKKLPLLELPDLFDEDKIVKVNTSDKLTLIDFWEVWCGPCIASFPKVESLKNKFSSELNVIGIVSEDQENAIKLVKKKGTTFQNLVGNNELEKEFAVNSWPRYFLVDKNGIVEKEYFGFSEQIEKDIVEFVSK
ncbi:TlpA family protein disulfide reductase [Kriegella aquimaris]|uniref:Thiol-disulfide isomerase or thioredoxin n=1 Tax=Kriegella aquimaris TaxID=192904 RepID=A0A1G9JKW7_9FLAO|nr:TlpA disulfide reductase family protein [Kriegella aquimaris]SDL38138.1 Thiol-disulfide isomerase or thioredoxin [Kriegella aquimaris]